LTACGEIAYDAGHLRSLIDKTFPFDQRRLDRAE